MERQGLSRREALQQLTATAAAAGLAGSMTTAHADAPKAFSDGRRPNDVRLGALKDLNGYFPFVPSSSPSEWAKRKEYVLRQMQIACGLWPMPSRPPIEATIHGRIERDGYTVDRVYFESSPGLLVTGSLYRPTDRKEKMPAILSPHGHWSTGRFYDAGASKVKQEIAAGAEQFEIGGRYPLQARCVQLARMGCVVFFYDMLGYADGSSLSYELTHRFAKQREHLSSPERWGLFSAQSELRLLNALGLQTWNSIRTLDWIETLSEVDASRIGVTGASGGGTQTFMLAALDERIAAAFPAVMVSTAMQGGCTCENATYLRVGTGNIEFAALVAPRPVAMSGANDWTVEIEKKGLPELQKHFEMLGVPDNVQAKYFDFPHNYNMQSRAMMYEFFNRHLKMGYESIKEADFVPQTRDELTVFNDDHPAPPKDEDAEVALLQALDEDLTKKIDALTPKNPTMLAKYRKVIGGALEVMIGRGMPGKDDIKYERLSEKEREGFLEYTAKLRFEKHGEELPTVFLFPNDWNSQVVVWISGKGKAALFDDEGRPIAAVAKLVKAGYAIASVDVLYTGESLKDGKALTQSRRVNNAREFAGYTLGYNHSLFAQRVHDILSVVSYSKHHETNPKAVHLVGVDGAGVHAICAAALARDALKSLAADTDGFRFSSITDVRDVDLLPGAVRYGDVTGILALAAPMKVWAGGESPATIGVMNDGYQVAGGSFTVYPGPKAGRNDELAGWIVGNG